MRVYILQVPILVVWLIFPLNNFSESITKASLVSAEVTWTLHREKNDGAGTYQQPCEGAVDRVDEERAWSDMNKKEQTINKVGLKQGHLKYLHLSKKVLTRHHHEKTAQIILGN